MEEDTVVFELSEKRGEQLLKVAAAHELSPEELLRDWLERHLEDQDEETRLQSEAAQAGLTVSEYLKLYHFTSL